MFKVNYEKNNAKIKCIITVNDLIISSIEGSSKEGAFELAYRDLIKKLFKARYISLFNKNF